jgi:hypothetical protein
VTKEISRSLGIFFSVLILGFLFLAGLVAIVSLALPDLPEPNYKGSGGAPERGAASSEQP